MDNLDTRSALVAKAEQLSNSDNFDQSAFDNALNAVRSWDAREKALDAVRAVKAKTKDDSDDTDTGDEETDDTDEEMCEGKKTSKRFYAPAALRSRGRQSVIDINDHAKREHYSGTKAIMSVRSNKSLTGVEREVNDELRRNGGSNGKGDFMMPIGENVYEKLNARAFGLTTASPVVSTDWVPQIVDYLAPQLVGTKLGFTYMTGLPHVTVLPAATSLVPASVGLAESAAPTNSVPTLTQYTLNPNTIGTSVTITRKLDIQACVDIDRWINIQSARAIAIKMDAASLFGTGLSNNQANGLFNNPLVPTTPASSGAFTYALSLAMEQAVAEANVDMYTVRYLTSPMGYERGINAVKIPSSTFPVFVINGDDRDATYDGSINGNPVLRSMQVPKGVTYSGTANTTCLILGAFNYLVSAWFGGGVEVVVDAVTSRAGDVTITYLLDIDACATQPLAFNICPNLT